ncbi:hypothetical protein D9O40_17565 [Clostridium autoethanogenum]|uniref:Uncharacterized protein n=1 Tax=Clostridium autoethanogenum TaxID=84023 RepID=A0A3M0SH32_9CLOT|nr:hypothetical protein D9O40_17565 [Clostridium autoethanogenum]
MLLNYNTINDSIKYTQEILKNCMLNGDNDENWYKIYLLIGTQTLSIQTFKGKHLTATVFSNDGTKIFQGTYGQSCKRGQKFNISRIYAKLAEKLGHHNPYIQIFTRSQKSNVTYRRSNSQRSVFPSDTALLKAPLATFEATKKWTSVLRN